MRQRLHRLLGFEDPSRFDASFCSSDTDLVGNKRFLCSTKSSCNHLHIGCLKATIPHPPHYPICHWVRGAVHPAQVANLSQRQTKLASMHTHTHTYSQLRFTSLACFWTVGGSQSTWRKPTLAQGEHTKNVQTPHINIQITHNITHVELRDSISKATR